MHTSLIQLLQIAVAVGVSSHALFNRFEPRALPFLGMLAAIYVFAAGYMYLYNPHLGVLYSVIASSAIVSGFVTGLMAAIAAYRLSPWHPLAGYPGPRLARLSKWYMAFWVARGSRHLQLQEMHRVYGAWVRIGPNELSVDDPEAIRPIYSQMFRSLSYQCAAQDADALLTTIDRDEHKLRLVSWAKAFSVEKLKHYRTSAQARTIQLVEILKKKEREPVALSHWILLWAIDVMGDMAFSGGYETLMAGKDVEGWTEVLHKGVLFVGVLGQVPWMKDLVALAPVPAPNLAIQKSTEKKIEETRRKTGGNRNDILSIIQNDTEGGIELTRLQLLADASLVMAAGSDTVSEAMTALMRYIAADAKIQWRLRVELTQAFDGPVEDMDAAMLLKLPYLDACVQEVLRLVPPVAAGPVRWNRDVDTQVLDKVIPAGTTVSSPNYAMFRDPRNFFDPNSFLPDRWLGGGSPHNGDAYVPFCFGAGTCIGKPVALHNMKLLTACLIRAFDISIPGDFDVGKFDESYKEHSLWVHDKLFVNLSPL